MLLPDQYVEITWSAKPKKHYESLGYQFTKFGDKFRVRAEHLSIGSREKVKVRCDDCEKIFERRFANHYNSQRNGEKDRCGSCATKFAHSHTFEQRRDKHFDMIQKICDEHGYELLTCKDAYTGSHGKIQYRCKKHGVKEATIDNFMHGHICIECSYEARGNGLRNSKDYVESYINSINGNVLLNKEDYVGSNTHNLRILCGSCGENIYETSFSDYYNNSQIRCRKCSKAYSSGELRIKEHLDSRGINYIHEKQFPDCVDKKVLPFDFYLPDYNAVIEFDGQHHFSPDVWGEEHYLTTQRHDEIKNQYCKDHGMRIIRIPYYDGHHIEEIIDSALAS